jgi:dolichyl-diphosphooligosaccharide--protein glycosyltransferase
MVNTKFPAMIAWYDPSLLAGYYTDTYDINTTEIPEYSGTLALLKQPYYLSMISRLHNFDGSFTTPGRVAYIEYWSPEDETALPSLSLYEILDSAEARERLVLFSAGPHGGKSATLRGFEFRSPLENVTALHHYRLVYEEAGLKPDGEHDPETMVKVFEYVPGARLAGEGTVEVDIQTNIGRTFTYRQESEGGFFILPYATQGSSYPVRTTGPYRIPSSGRTFDISEDEIKTGQVISGI